MSNRTDRAIEMLFDANVIATRAVIGETGAKLYEFQVGKTRIKAVRGKGVYVYSPRNTNGLTKHAGSGNAFYVSTDRAMRREVKAFIRLTKKR